MMNLIDELVGVILRERKTMKEIKCRAWNKVDKTMYTDAINNGKDSFDMMLKHPQIYDIMRFIGLPDNSGVEIYEGDILMQNNNPVDLAVVCYGEFGVRSIDTEEVIDNAVGWYLKVLKTDAISEMAPFCYDRTLNEYWIKETKAVVFGNIHENPGYLEA